VPRRTWAWFAVWALVGASYPMTLLGAFTIGIFFVPVALGGTVLLARRRTTSTSWPGAIAGVGLPAFAVAWLNRGGVAHQQLDPIPWLAGGLVLVAIAVSIFIALRRADDKQRSLA